MHAFNRSARKNVFSPISIDYSDVFDGLKSNWIEEWTYVLVVFFTC
jgi:hypothetical protein